MLTIAGARRSTSASEAPRLSTILAALYDAFDRVAQGSADRPAEARERAEMLGAITRSSAACAQLVVAQRLTLRWRSSLPSIATAVELATIATGSWPARRRGAGQLADGLAAAEHHDRHELLSVEVVGALHLAQRLDAVASTRTVLAFLHALANELDVAAADGRSPRWARSLLSSPASSPRAPTSRWSTTVLAAGGGARQLADGLDAVATSLSRWKPACASTRWPSSTP